MLHFSFQTFRQNIENEMVIQSKKQRQADGKEIMNSRSNLEKLREKTLRGEADISELIEAMGKAQVDANRIDTILQV